VKSVLRVNAGVGYDTGDVAFTAEVTNLYSTGVNDSVSGTSWVNSGALSARVRTASVLPYGAIVFPLDHDSHTVMDAVLVLGIEAPLR
jgi:hypothetical protein